jgi:hypothetical protein
MVTLRADDVHLAGGLAHGLLKAQASVDVGDPHHPAANGSSGESALKQTAVTQRWWGNRNTSNY